jgi:hypothetical protein
MAEEKKTVTAKTPGEKSTTPSGRADRPTPEAKDAAGEKRPGATQPEPSPSLRPASESSDPAVHQLLAEQDIARQNEDEDEAKRTQDALADLGYE